MDKEIIRSCADCGVAGCKRQTSEGRPPFCLTEHMDKQAMDEAMEAYHEAENHRVMTTAADVEYEGYCRWTRIREIVEFARRMGYRKLGIAACVGLLHEARIAAGILRSHGF